MEKNLTFIDQTLGYAWENQYLRSSEFIDVKRKISALSQIVFDLTLQSFVTVLQSGMVDIAEIRVCIQPDAKQVVQARQLGCKYVKIALTDKTVKKLAASEAEALSQARAGEMTIALHISGSCQYSVSSIRRLRRLVQEYGISSIVFDDEHSALDPMLTYETLLKLQQQIPCLVEYYGKNAMGLATGNALGAIKSGVRHIAVSVGGVAGYPAIEEVLMGGWVLLKFPLEVPKNIAACCEEILHYVDQRVQPTKPIIGCNIFAHESGIHVDGVNKKSDLYEPFTPETVGLLRKIIIGKHSGKAAIELKLKELNLSVQPTAVMQVLEKVRDLAIWQKAPVSDKQLRELVYEVAS